VLLDLQALDQLAPLVLQVEQELVLRYYFFGNQILPIQIKETEKFG
jgi:hypothetical protein